MGVDGGYGCGFVLVHVPAHVCVFWHMQIWKTEFINNYSVTLHSQLWFFETQSLTELEACHLVSLPGQQIPWVHLSPSSSAEVTDRC